MLVFRTAPTIVQKPLSRIEGIRAVIIDLDGTLLHTLPDMMLAANAMLRELGHDHLPEATIESFVGKGAAHLVMRCLGAERNCAPEPKTLSHALTVFERHYHAVNGQQAQLYPGVLEGLDALVAAGLRLAVVTNKPLQFALPVLKQKQLDHYFELVLGGDSLPQKKPHPAPMWHVANTFNLAAHQLLAVGDSSNDALAARAAGMPVLLLPYGYNHGEPVDRVDCNGIVESIAQAAALVI
jgi:phosphoglycolate phosphatase